MGIYEINASEPVFVYINGLKHIFKGRVDLEDGNVKGILVSDDYVPNPMLDEFYEDIIGEITAEGYSTGGESVLDVNILPMIDDFMFKVDMKNLLFENVIGNFKYILIYYDKIVFDAKKPLIAGYFFEDEQVSNGGLRFNFSPNGVFRIQL